MKIMLVEFSLNGHRKRYIEEIVKGTKEEIFLLLPQNIEFDQRDIKVVHEKLEYATERTVTNYFKMLKMISDMIVEYDIDIVHVLDGDSFYRFWGIGLGKLINSKIVITCHHLYTYGWRKWAIRSLFKVVDKVIVHTSYLEKYYKSKGVKSVRKIEYPVFGVAEFRELDVVKCRDYFSLPKEKIVIGALGATNRYKGLKILLDALIDVGGEYHLLVAGREADTTKEYIESFREKLGNRLTLELRHLTNEEYKIAVAACDIIALPYLKEFNGASGPWQMVWC